MAGVSTCNRRYNERVASSYAGYARIVSRHSGKVFLLGLTIAIVACVGLINTNTSHDVLNLWMYKGTRLDGEKDFYEEFFGGNTRAQSVMVSNTDGSNAATTRNLDVMLEATQPFVPGNDQEVKVSLSDVAGSTETFGVPDVCLSPPVPPAMKPYPPDPNMTTFAWFQQGAFMSYGYRQVSLCVKDGDGPLPTPTVDLEDGWGIERLPCSRLTPLDCFQEGNYDYPEAMKQLDAVSTFVAFNNETKTSECVEEFGVGFQAVLESVGLSVEEASAGAAEASAQLASTILAFWSWGYHWRKAYADMTDAEVVEHLREARAFANDVDSNTITGCIATGGACCLSWAGTKLETDFLFAGVDEAAGSIKYLLTSQANFPMNHPAWIGRMDDRMVTDEDGREDVALGWESEFREEMMPRFERAVGSGYGPGEEYEDVDLDFFTERSGNDMVEKGNRPEAYLVIIAYVGMLIFAALAMGSWNLSQPRSMVLYSRVLLSLGGMFIIALSTVACLGLISALSVDLTPLSIMVVPFLSLGIGIDDMFIFIYTLIHATNCPGNPGRRLQVTLVHAGPSVTITSVSNAGCFLLATAVSIPTIRNFALHMGLQMLLHLVLFHLMLVPMMYWDSVRVTNRRTDVILTKLDEEGIIPEKIFANANGTKHFVQNWYAPLLRKSWFKAATIVIAIAMTAVLTWRGVTDSTLGVGLNTLAEKGSHEKSFLEIYEFDFSADTISLVTEEVDLGEYQQTLLDIQDAVQEVKWVSDVSSIKDNSWLADSFTSFLGPGATPVNATDFNTLFGSWIAGAGITKANDFYCAQGSDGPRVDCTEFDPATTVIKASTQNFYLHDQNSRENNVDMFRDTRKAADGVDPERRTFAYSDTFALHSQYSYTWHTFGWIVGGGAVMVAIVITLLQGSLTVSLLIAFSIVMVVLQVFGFLTLIDVGMNGFSIVNLCVMVGLVVEFTAHIGRGFLFAPGTDRQHRAEHALIVLLWPTFAGACTTFLAVLPMTFSRITFFHNYYFQTFAIMAALGFFAGVCLLPVLLSIFGPPSMHLPKQHNFYNDSVTTGGAGNSDPTIAPMSAYVAAVDRARGNGI